MLYRLCTCLALLLAATAAGMPVTFLPASAQALVTGVVLGERNRPLEAAAVELLQVETNGRLFGTATGTTGQFAFENVPDGRYRLVVTFLGHETFSQDITVGENSQLDLRAELVTKAVESPEVVVTAGRARERLTPITFTSVTARDLAQKPSMKDLPAHLASAPSITYYTENGNDLGYTHLRMRGFGQRRLAVAINGIPQNDPEEHSVFWINFFDLQGTIEDIQIQRGAGAAFYGSTGIGGAINVVARPYKPAPYASAEIGYGTFDTRRFTLEANTGLLGGRYVAFGRLSRLLSDGYRDWSWSKFWRYFAGVTRYGTRHTITIQAYGGPQRDALAYAGIPKAANRQTVTDDFGTAIDRRYNFSSFTGDVERFRQPHVELHHQGQLSQDWMLRQSLFWIRGVGYFDFGGTFRSADYLRLPNGWRDLDSELRQLPLYITAPDAHVFFRAALDQWQAGWMPRVSRRHATGETTLSAEARLHRSTRWGRIQEATALPAQVVGSANDARVYSVRGEKAIASLLASHLYRPVPKIALQADAQITWRRYRIFDEAFFGTEFSVPYFFVNPRVGITVNPEQRLSGYASFALANREPRMKSLYDGEEAGAGFIPQFERRASGGFDYSAPFVRPEQLLDVELGVRLDRGRLDGVAGLYWMEFRDEIVPSGGLDQFGVPRTGNADRTRHIGFEVEANLAVSGALRAFGNATFSRNRFVQFVEYVTLDDFSSLGLDRAGNPIAGFPSRVANLGVGYQKAGLSAQADVAFAGLQYVDNSGGKSNDGTAQADLSVDAFALVNATVRYAFGETSRLRGLSVGADLNNVLNSKVLLFGTVGFGTPEFFPAATRHVFVGAKYTVR